MKKILVTGAGGLAGQAIARYLVKTGNHVTGTLFHKRVDNPSFETVVIDLSKRILLNDSYDVIVHTAGCLPYRNCNLNDYFEGNVLTMKNLVDFALEKQVPKFINLSTIGIYGEFRQAIINEGSDRINPDGYGMTKYIAEEMLREEKSIQSISLRMPGIIGQGARGIWMSRILDKMRNNEAVTIFSPEFITKNFVWIEDLARFLDVLVHRETFLYPILILACKEGAKVRDIVSKLKEETGSKSEILIDNSAGRSFCLNAEKAREMGYQSLEPLNIVSEYLKK